ncbi:MAG: MBOAT family protein [Deltaproteobacteria bacterium]|nr:MBOAT family protein [Deltaproteobacteria bacterium]
MLFNSFAFLIFFPTVCALYFALPHRVRWMVLLAASFYFYGSWRWSYLPLLLFTTLLSYSTAIVMDTAPSPAMRRFWLIVSLVGNFSVLFTYKYCNLFSQTGETIAHSLGLAGDWPRLSLVLPIGISFYTFHALSYSIDVYRRTRAAERHLGLYALYVAFFPLLVAGPIERSTTLLPQLRKSFPFEYQRVVSGLQLMAWGFFKKLVIADRISVYVDQVYTDPTAFGGLQLTIATVLFAYQIYCDFSGYSDVAIGAAEVLGYTLLQNFRQPYLADTIQGFWRRWHISLSTWFRDYLYLSLGGNRVATTRWYFNIMAVFLLSGLWHGASWTFVVWGFLHGFYQVFGLATRAARGRLAESIGLARLPRLRHALQVACTFALVDFAWIFFRAGTFDDAFYVATHFYRDWDFHSDVYLVLGAYEFWLAMAAIVVLEIVQTAQRRVRIRWVLADKPVWARWSLYYAAVMTVLLLGKAGGAKFLYFQF